MKRLALLVTALLLDKAAALAQCSGDWRPGFGLAYGLYGSVQTSLVVSNGTSQPTLYIAGDFNGAETAAASRIARWNGRHWESLPAGERIAINHSVLALEWYEGELIAGGAFTDIGGEAISRIARWNGVAWQPMGTGIGPSGSVRDLTTFQGELIAAGSFSTADGSAIESIARWDGQVWRPLQGALGEGIPSGAAYALEIYNNELIVAGGFSQAGGRVAHGIAKWNGSDWSALGAGGMEGVSGGTVNACAVYAGKLIVGGEFHTAGGQPANRVAAWDGTQWHTLAGPTGEGVNYIVQSLAVFDGEVVVGGGPHGGVPGPDRITAWNGTSWRPLSGHDLNPVFDLNVFDGRLMAFGHTLFDGQTIGRASVWDGSTWALFGSGAGGGVDDSVFSLLSKGEDLYAGGIFVHAGGEIVNTIARWDGQAWSALPGVAGVGTDWSVDALVEYEGDLIAGGTFNEIGGVFTSNVARWNGERWSRIGTGNNWLFGGVFSLLVHNDELIAGGYVSLNGGLTNSYVVRWNGSTWQTLGIGSADDLSGQVEVLSVYQDDLVAGGSFYQAGGQDVGSIARWDGLAWHALGGGVRNKFYPHVGYVFALAEYQGSLVVGGRFEYAGSTRANNIALWDGDTWSALINNDQAGVPGGVRALRVLDDDLIVAGSLRNEGTLIDLIARWNGVEWLPLANGLSGYGNLRYVRALEEHKNELFAGGRFAVSGETWYSSNIAAWRRCGLGDMNCNGVSNVADIAGFVAALTDPPTYYASFPDCDLFNADCSENGVVNVADIGSFVSLLTGE